MVAGLKFLSKKGFNPQNLTNQKRVWEKEQEKKQAVKKAKEREAQLKRERDDEELALARGDAPKLAFMYVVPPGIEETTNSSAAADGDRKPAASNALTERQPGDDDAAAAFRRLLASNAERVDQKIAAETHQSATATAQGAFGLVLQGTSCEADNSRKSKNDSRSALEKAVGRRDAGAALSLDDQVQRFPALANAPRAKGMTATDVGITFKPLGTQIRNIKCLACGIWGHSRGDRECQKSGWDPFAAARPPTASSSIMPQEGEGERRRRRGKEDLSDEGSSSSSISSSDGSSRDKKRRKKKNRKRSKKQHRRSRSQDDDSYRDRKERHNSHKKRKRDRER